MASPSIAKVESKTRKHRALKQRIKNPGMADDPDSIQDAMPVVHKEVPSGILDKFRARKTFQSAGLLGQDKLLGQLNYSDSIVDEARAAAGKRSTGRLA